MDPPFSIEPELASVLEDMSDEDLLSFAKTQETPTNDEEFELHAYTCPLTFTGLRSVEYLERAIHHVEGWIAETPEDHKDRARRLQTLDLLVARHLEFTLSEKPFPTSSQETCKFRPRYAA